MQYAPSETPPEHCPICEDERQYVGWNGQQWTTLDALIAEGRRNELSDVEADLFQIATRPQVAIGQRALVVETAAGNVMWDCVSLVDDESIAALRARGGLSAIAISHPHFYASMVGWSAAFGNCPIYIHATDEDWVQYRSPGLRLWQGETIEILPGITLINTGGHFAGSTALHAAQGCEGRGMLLVGDSLTVVMDRRYLSFMYSYPNLIPLPADAVRRIAASVRPFSFERIYGGWDGRNVTSAGNDAVERSAERYIRYLERLPSAAASTPPRTWESEQAAEIWRQGAARRAETLALATERLLDAADLRPGMHVLDVAAGTGDQTLLAAARIGPGGTVVATDISAPMLAAAAQNAHDAGLSNVTTLVSDASALEVPETQFDAAICRFGLMFVPDLHEALRRIYRALKPGGHFAALMWAARDRNPWMSIQIEVLTDIGRAPAPGASVLQALSLSEPEVLIHALSASGFREVQTSSVATPRTYASVDEALEGMLSASPAQSALLQQLGGDEREHYVTSLKRRLSAYADGGGRVAIPGEAILAVGSRPQVSAS